MPIQLHIGTEKTGTTSLQRFLSTNRAALSTQGIVVPTTPGTLSHSALAVYASDSGAGEMGRLLGVASAAELPPFREAFRRRFLAEVTGVGDAQVLLSSEHCSSRLPTTREIQRLLDLLREVTSEIRVIVYLRRQDDLLLSQYSTRIKSGSTKTLTVPTIANGSALPRYFDYRALLAMWEQAVGRGNLCVRVLEASQLRDGNVIADASEVLGIELRKLVLPPKQNVSLDAVTLEFLRLLNRYLPAEVEGQPNPLRVGLIPALTQLAIGPPISRPDEELAAFMNHFQSDNEFVARHYLGRQDGILFREDRTSRGQAIRENVSAEELMEISAKLWAGRICEARAFLGERNAVQE